MILIINVSSKVKELPLAREEKDETVTGEQQAMAESSNVITLHSQGTSFFIKFQKFHVA